MLRAVVYIPNLEHFSLAQSIIERSDDVHPYYCTDIDQLEGMMRSVDCHLLMIFMPRKVADLGTSMSKVFKYVYAWNIPVSIVSSAVTLKQLKKLRSLNIADFAVLPVRPGTLKKRMARTANLIMGEHLMNGDDSNGGGGADYYLSSMRYSDMLAHA